MDNICHTLVGAALAGTGLRRRTGLAAATMMIGANFPDIDVIAVPLGHSIEWRRGWTHGILALVVLPFLLTALMMAWDRWGRSPAKRLREPVVPRQLLLLAAIAILTHPVLDWLNSYGMRWLMPFDGTWSYGDSLFIIDPWLWLVLGLGAWLSRRRLRTRHARPWQPARIAVGVATTYIVGMLAMHEAAERLAARKVAARGYRWERLIVSAAPANPFAWRVHVDDGERYRPASLVLLSNSPMPVAFDDQPIDKNDDHPAARAAARTERGRGFLDWARLPYYRVHRRGDRTLVTITDARYGAKVEIPVD